MTRRSGVGKAEVMIGSAQKVMVCGSGVLVAIAWVLNSSDKGRPSFHDGGADVEPGFDLGAGKGLERRSDHRVRTIPLREALSRLQPIRRCVRSWRKLTCGR